MRWDIGIDIGTENTRAAMLGEGIVTDMPSCIAFRGDQEDPFAYGREAYALRGRAGGNLRVAYPLTDGVLMNASDMGRVLRRVERDSDMRDLLGKRLSCVLTCAPFARQVQQDAMLSTTLDTGAGEAVLMRSDMACAVGAGMDVHAPEAFLVVDVGAGKITCTLFTMGRVAAFGYIPYGISRLDGDIMRAVREKRAHVIGAVTAREIRHALGSADANAYSAQVKMTVSGLSVEKRIPEHFDVQATDVADVFRDFTRELARMCRGTLTDIPEELAADLNDTGCMLVGGGAHLAGIDKLLERETGVPCHVADVPEMCAVWGLFHMMTDAEEYETGVMSRLSRLRGANA